MTTLLQLMYEFAKTGLFSVGGGLATLPFLYEMSSRHPDWFTSADVADMSAWFNLFDSLPHRRFGDTNHFFHGGRTFVADKHGKGRVSKVAFIINI